MPETTSPNELVPVHLIAYDDDADLEIDNSGEDATVENHAELVANGQTHSEIRALSRSSAEEYDLDIVEPGDPLWDDRFHDLEPGDSWRVEELRG